MLGPIQFRQALQGCPVAGEAIGDDLLGRRTRMAEQFAEEPLRRLRIPAFLQEDIEGLAVLIDHPPQVSLLALDPYEYLVQVPGPPGPALPTTQLRSGVLSEAAHPATYALVAELNAALCKQLLHVSIAQGEAHVEPHGVAAHFSREVEAAVEIGALGHGRGGAGVWAIGTAPR